MDEPDLFRAVLEWLPVYGPQLLGLAPLVALCCALGIPLPAPMMVLAAGALARQGDAQAAWVIAGCFAGSLLGESVYYFAGRYAGAWVQGHAGRFVAGAWQKAEERFAAQAGLTVYLTRFLLTPIGIPTNLIAGSRGYAYWRFALWALAGDAMWIGGYGLAGYLGGSRWQEIASMVAVYAVPIACVVAAGIVLARLWRKRAGSRMAPASMELAADRVRPAGEPAFRRVA